MTEIVKQQVKKEPSIKAEKTKAQTTARKAPKAPKGWPANVWFSPADAARAAEEAGVSADRADGDFEMADLLMNLLVKQPQLADKALANMKPHVVDQVHLRVEHAETIAMLREMLKKQKHDREIARGVQKKLQAEGHAAADKKKTEKKKKPRKLPAKFLTASQEVMCALENAFNITEENRQLLLDHPDALNISTIGRFAKNDDDGRIMQAAIRDRQAAAPLYAALNKLFESLMNPPTAAPKAAPKADDDDEEEPTEPTVKDWALQNNRAMNKVTLALWKDREALVKAHKKAGELASARARKHEKELLENKKRERSDESAGAEEEEPSSSSSANEEDVKKKRRVATDQEEEHEEEEF